MCPPTTLQNRVQIVFPAVRRATDLHRMFAVLSVWLAVAVGALTFITDARAALPERGIHGSTAADSFRSDRPRAQPIQFAQVRRSLSRSGVKRTTRAVSKQVRSRVRRAKRRIRGDAGPIRAAAFDSDGRVLFAASADNTIRAWNFETGGVVRTWRGQAAGVNDLALSPDASHLASAGADGTILVWNLEQDGPPRSLAGHVGGVRSISFHPQGLYLGSGGDDGSGQIWDIATGQPAAPKVQHDGAVTAVGWTVDSRYFVTGGAGGETRLWRLGGGLEPIRLKGRGTGTINALTLSSDGRYLATATGKGRLVVWDISARRELRSFRAQKGAVLSIAMGSDPAKLATAGADGVARLWDLDTGRELRRFKGHTGQVRSVSMSPNGQVLVTAGEDGTSRVWRATEGREVATLIATERGWAVFNDQGQFDAPEDSFQDIDWVAEDKVFGLDKFSARYYEPGLLARAVAGEAIERSDLPTISEGFDLPPEVQFLAPTGNITIREPALRVTLAAQDAGGGIGDVLIYHNGRLLGASRLKDRDLDDDKGTLTVTYRAALLDGDNIFRAVAYSDEGIEGEAQQVKVFFDGSVGRGVLNVLAIGINRYKKPEFDLNYAIPDADGIASLFEKRSRVGFQDLRITRLFDDRATKSGIMSALKNLASTAPQDVVVVYYAGHGEVVDREWYLLPHDLETRTPDGIRDKGIPGKDILDLLSGIEAQNVLLMIDSCKSGRAITAFRKFKVKRNLRSLARRLGVHVLAATEKLQLATELPALGHGTYTYALLEGAAGPADIGRDGKLAVSEWLTYAGDRIPRLLKELKLPMEQTPVAFSWGNDFNVMSVQ